MPHDIVFIDVLVFVNWCCERGLNSRPHHYQWCALPLSYRSIFAGGKLCPGPACIAIKGRAAQEWQYASKRIGSKCLANNIAQAYLLIMAQSKQELAQNNAKRRAEKLRENLARRKQQLRQRAANPTVENESGPGNPDENSEENPAG
jgi:hypothetical protein